MRSLPEWRVAYWPSDTSEPVLELTTGDLLRAAASDAGTQTALIEAAPPGWSGVTELPLTGSGKIQKFRLREQINRAELKDLATG